MLLCERMRDTGCEILDKLPIEMPEIVAERKGALLLKPAPPTKARM